MGFCIYKGCKVSVPLTELFCVAHAREIIGHLERLGVLKPRDERGDFALRWPRRSA